MGSCYEKKHHTAAAHKQPTSLERRALPRKRDKNLRKSELCNVNLHQHPQKTVQPRAPESVHVCVCVFFVQLSVHKHPKRRTAVRLRSSNLVKIWANKAQSHWLKLTPLFIEVRRDVEEREGWERCRVKSNRIISLSACSSLSLPVS